MDRKVYKTVIIEKTVYLKMKDAASKKKLDNMQDFYKWIVELVEKELQKDPELKIEKVPSTIQELWQCLNERAVKLEQ